MKESASKCLVCGASKKSLYKKVGKYTYWKCSKCTIIYADPIKSQKFYLATETYLSDPTIYSSIINIEGQRWMIDQFERLYSSVSGSRDKGSLFEIGAGIGFFTLFAYARGWEAKGIEASGPSANYAKNMLKVDVEHSILETYKTKSPFDAVAMVEVLEHFINPIDAVSHIKRISKKGTIVFGTTPNTDSKHWDSGEQDIYVPDDHIYLFNKKSLKKFAKLTGLKKLTIEYFGSGEEHDSNLMYCAVLK